MYMHIVCAILAQAPDPKRLTPQYPIPNWKSLGYLNIQTPQLAFIGAPFFPQLVFTGVILLAWATFESTERIIAERFGEGDFSVLGVPSRYSLDLTLLTMSTHRKGKYVVPHQVIEFVVDVFVFSVSIAFIDRG